MREDDIIGKTSKIWQLEATPATVSAGIIPDLETQKRLLQLFHVGDFYYYVFDLKRMDLPFVSPEINTILGDPQNNWTIQEIVSRIHPGDVDFFVAAEKELTQFFTELPAEKLHNYKARYDLRLRRNDGSYIRVLLQIMVFESDRSENELKSFCVHTDITHLKKDVRPVLSLIGMNGEPSFIDVLLDRRPLGSLPFTRRESEILPMLLNGMTSQEIADVLNISRHTVDTHRRKMLRETNTRSTAELVSAAVREGWI